MRRIRITLHLSRYQSEKLLGDRWRVEGEPGETFTQFRKRIKKESK